MVIRQLPDNLVNRIAAGEVVERPASVVKELLENSIDAGSTQITIVTENGGKSIIRVQDDGAGIEKNQFKLALSRHATSKLVDDDLTNISTLGFRGEGLSSISSVSRLSLISRTKQNNHAWKITSFENDNITPASANQGTNIEVRDIFYNIPARQKFLRTNTTENNAINNILRRLCIAFYGVSFKWISDNKIKLEIRKSSDTKSRIKSILGNSFIDNSASINNSIKDIRINGFISLPHYHHINGKDQFIYINGRPVRDKIIQMLVGQAYKGIIPSGRYPRYVLFLHLPPSDLDINVHPMKLEVRFRFPHEIRQLVLHQIHSVLSNQQISSRPSLNDEFTERSYKDSKMSKGGKNTSSFNYLSKHAINEIDKRRLYSNLQLNNQDNNSKTSYSESQNIKQEIYQLSDVVNLNLVANLCLGQARCQISSKYIIAERNDDLVIIDQHAAAERIVYEELKNKYKYKPIPAIQLLTKIICNISENDAEIILKNRKSLFNIGFDINAGDTSTSIIVNSYPDVLSSANNINEVLLDIASELSDFEEDELVDNNHHVNDIGNIKPFNSISLLERLRLLLAKRSCYGSIRAGRKMNIVEMNALIKQMEETPFSDVCIHGRPSHIIISKNSLDKLFKRK